MASKLKNLKITKVDFVDAGANPEANVMLYKNESGTPGGIQKEDKTAAREGHDPQKQAGVLKRFISAIGKAIGLEPEEIDATVEEIEKGDAADFGSKLKERNLRRVGDEIWDLCYALQESLCSIIYDDEAENKQELMEKSVEQFGAAMTQAISQWVSGNTAGIIKKSDSPATKEEIQFMQYSMKRLEDMVSKAGNTGEQTGSQSSTKTRNEKEGEIMIDKSLLTPAERAFYEDIEKRCSTSSKNGGKEAGSQEKSDGKGKEEEDKKEKEPDVKKSAPGAETVQEDIYAGLHPIVAAELQRLQKRADEADEKELAEVAKKYEIIGKKPEELIPVLKSLKSAGGTAYTDMLSILDASVEAVNKSSMFTEIGKSGGHMGGEPDAWAKIEKKADEMQAASPGMSRVDAIDAACRQNPQLVHEYENGN